MPTRVRERMIEANASIIRVGPQLSRTMEQTPTSAAPCSGLAGSPLGNGDQILAPPHRLTPEALGQLPLRGLGPIARSPPEGGIPERPTPATAVRLLPPARDGAATAPMSYLGLPLGAEARRLVSKSPNWDAGPGTGSYNERQSARAV